MLINDYSPQDFLKQYPVSKVSVTDVLTAGIIFLAPVIFLLVLSAN